MTSLRMKSSTGAATRATCGPAQVRFRVGMEQRYTWWPVCSRTGIARCRRAGCRPRAAACGPGPPRWRAPLARLPRGTVVPRSWWHDVAVVDGHACDRGVHQDGPDAVAGPSGSIGKAATAPSVLAGIPARHYLGAKDGFLRKSGPTGQGRRPYRSGFNRSPKRGMPKICGNYWNLLDDV
jgi:hypothetical protein